MATNRQSKKLTGAVTAVCIGKKGELKGPWSSFLVKKRLVRDFCPPEFAEMNEYWPA